MSFPIIHFGLETEYGVTCDGEEEVDVVAESIALVRSATEQGVWMRWDYGAEDPHADMRGFRVGRLRQDTDEANYFAQDAERELSFVEIKSDLVLGNGARFYNDHAHPEYCTPECTSVTDLVNHDRAGERIVMACAEHLTRQRGRAVRLYKNNTDFFGHSYGCHENYLLPRSLPWDLLVKAIQPFLVTRQIFAGSGKFAIEAEDKFVAPAFQISQRSDFICELQSVDTMQRRPLINTRDEPHANPERFRRFHVIVGDSNMSPLATMLKAGTMALVLEALVRRPRAKLPRLADPIASVISISRDRSFQWEVPLESGTTSNAIEIQRAYLALVKNECDLALPDRVAVVQEWEAVLNDLATDYWRCRDRVDWVAKLGLVRDFQQSQGLADDDPWLRSLDLEYHRLDAAEGLYFGLEQSKAIRGLPDEAAVHAAIKSPPPTRAYVRGKCIQKFASAVLSAQWDHITLQGKGSPIKISLMNLFAPDEMSRYAAAIDAATVPEDLRILEEVTS